MPRHERSASRETDFDFSKSELRILRGLRTPARVQQFLDDEVRYNKERKGETCRSPRRVLRDRLAHCMEGALFGAAALRVHGHPPLLIELLAVRDDHHALAVFRENGLWGAIAQSNYSGLGYRAPAYRTIRELVMSYFDQYFNDPQGEYTLREYSLPVSLARYDARGWMTSESELFWVDDIFGGARHYRVIPKGMRPGKVRDRVFRAGCLGKVSR